MEIFHLHSGTEAFLAGLDKKTASRVDQMIDRLKYAGHELRMPYSKSLGSGLFELRVNKGARQIRILYVFHENNAIVLHIFFKKTWRIPGKEITYARKLWKMHLA